METSSFSIKGMYKLLRGQYINVPSRRLICNNPGSPRWLFILYLALQKKLYTRDRLEKWGITTEILCPLCNNEVESHQHLCMQYDQADMTTTTGPVVH